MLDIADGFYSVSAEPGEGDAAPTPAEVIAVGFREVASERPIFQRRGPQLPAGTAHRSEGHAQIMRSARTLKKEQRDHQHEREGNESLRSVWNTENGLRQGDNVAVGLPHQFSSAHPNEWSLSGAMKIGWKEVGGQGAHFRGLGGVGETRHHQQALSILAGGLQEAHGHAFSTWLDGLPDGAVLHIERHYDPTQLFLSFGAMAQDLQESARYLIPDPDVEGQWKAVSWNKF
eukprot:3927825-Pyramimonas_sp.AAC.1